MIPPDVVYTWGHETYLPSFEESLPRIYATRRQHLKEIDMDAAPLESLDWLHEMWGVPDERAAERHLLSFASCSCLPRSARLRALNCEDTTERFRLAEEVLSARRGVLRARLAVADAVG